MKKTLSMVLVVAMLALSVFALASCGLSGSYVDPTGLTTLEFSGSTVTITTESGALSLTYNAQYEISDKDGGKVFHYLLGLSDDIGRINASGLGIDRNLTRGEDQISAHDSLGIRADGGRCGVGFDDVAHICSFSMHKIDFGGCILCGTLV